MEDLNVKLYKKSGIYIIINKSNGKVYIGSSAYLEKRRSAHFRKLIKGIHENKHLQSSFNKNGIDNFEFRVLEFILGDLHSEEFKLKILEREQFWVNKYMSYMNKKGYNMRPEVSSNLGIKLGPMKPEHKQKIRIANTGFKQSKETVEKSRLARIGTQDKPVINMTTGLKFKSMLEASIFYRIHRQGISMTCRGIIDKSGGYKWAYISKDGKIVEPKFISKDTRKTIINIDTGDIFDSIMQASKLCNVNRSNINQCCKSKVKTAGGYHWMYYEDYLKQQDINNEITYEEGL